MSNIKILILILILIFHINSSQFIPIYDIIGNISSFNIPIKEENYYNTIIDSLIEIMENYAFINLLKSPPKVDGLDYFNKVDVIQDLKNLKSDIEGKTPNFYHFYQKISKIIASINDYHIIFSYKGTKAPFDILSKLIITSPIQFDFQRDKKVLVNINKLIYLLNNEALIENSDIIIKNYNNKIDVVEINGKNINKYIQDFCADYCRFKSKNSKFVFNRQTIVAFSLWQCPLSFNELKDLNITYSNGEIITSKYLGFIQSSNDIKFNEEKFSLNNNYQIKKFFLEEKNNKITWDINIDNKIKCKVDHQNQINVVLQNSFSPNPSDPMGIINNMSYCHGNFTNNDYPIIVIENLNAGGFAQISKLMQQMIQDLMYPKNYFSIIHNKNTKQFIYDNKDSFLFVNDKETKNLTIEEFYNDKIIEQFGDINIERSKQKILLDLNFESLIKNNIFKRNKIKKPTDIIIFTDGLSFSATSVFIKNIYYFGGAILVGYSGNPELESFDASQNPTFPLTNLKNIKGYNELLKKGFEFSRISSGPMYRTSYDKNNENIPEEFTVNLVDERINIYNEFSDDLYEDFIFEAKKIFEKYKNECNPNNKYLNLLKKECSFNDTHLHGGYKCGTNGLWNETCVPFYCDEDYYFEPNTKTCIKIKENNENNEDDSSILVVLLSIYGIILVIIIILVVLYKTNKFHCKKKEIDYNSMKNNLMNY